MINLTLWKSIINFIDEYKKNTETTGILICGSFTRGKLRPGSDIDILLLQKNINFEMEVLPNNEYPIDRLHAMPEVIESILLEKSEFSDILSLSLGTTIIIIEDSPSMRKVIEIAEKNIKERSLVYTAPITKEPHVVNGDIFTVKRINSRYFLQKNGITEV